MSITDKGRDSNFVWLRLPPPGLVVLHDPQKGLKSGCARSKASAHRPVFRSKDGSFRTPEQRKNPALSSSWPPPPQDSCWSSKGFLSLSCETAAERTRDDEWRTTSIDLPPEIVNAHRVGRMLPYRPCRGPCKAAHSLATIYVEDGHQSNGR
ncbi:hypothetical protein LZ32DRAFT_409883 [Colletotrichum eremochloae]|nr:hypothetical protein LZ32DRAFT_409883 [Colletotrichum eremochloae]